MPVITRSMARAGVGGVNKVIPMITATKGISKKKKKSKVVAPPKSLEIRRLMGSQEEKKSNRGRGRPKKVKKVLPAVAEAEDEDDVPQEIKKTTTVPAKLPFGNVLDSVAVNKIRGGKRKRNWKGKSEAKDAENDIDDDSEVEDDAEVAVFKKGQGKVKQELEEKDSSDLDMEIEDLDESEESGLELPIPDSNTTIPKEERKDFEDFRGEVAEGDGDSSLDSGDEVAEGDGDSSLDSAESSLDESTTDADVSSENATVEAIENDPALEVPRTPVPTNSFKIFTEDVQETPVSTGARRISPQARRRIFDGEGPSIGYGPREDVNATMMSQNETLNTYDITAYEDLPPNDESKSYRDGKYIPSWAAGERLPANLFQMIPFNRSRETQRLTFPQLDPKNIIIFPPGSS